ncbi:hypothetical protein [Candidatus Tisiphia endosymbiont of Oplodontha viridula]|uniref:hypothetical protein n=1 Tax=Candidatus Tisiphia endosymbiont of Oplodontha viridula TaxID=3077925 RepID=UPI0035C90FDB
MSKDSSKNTTTTTNSTTTSSSITTSNSTTTSSDSSSSNRHADSYYCDPKRPWLNDTIGKRGGPAPYFDRPDSTNLYYNPDDFLQSSNMNSRNEQDANVDTLGKTPIEDVTP